MTGRWGKGFAALLLAVVLLVGVGATAFAADDTVDLTKKGSIQLTLRESGGDYAPIPGGKICLYQVAEAHIDNETLHYAFTPAFADSGVSLGDGDVPGLAEHLAGYAKEKQIEGVTKATGEDGTVQFDQLELGAYLVTEEGAVPGYYQTTPFLVMVPMANPKGSGWVYDVEANPKTEKDPSQESPDEKITLTVNKVWVDDGTHPESVAVNLLRDGEVYGTVTLSAANHWSHTWQALAADHRWSAVEAEVPTGYTVLYDSTDTTVTITNTKQADLPEDLRTLKVVKRWEGPGDHPSAITVELRKDGVCYDRVELSAANGWSHTWNELPYSEHWVLRECRVPAGYTASYVMDGTTAIITNTKRTPSKPVASQLVQTGQWNWPIPVLLLLGLGCIVVGLILKKKDKN